MAAGPIALIGWLAVVSLVIIVIAGLILAVTRIAPDGGEPLGFVEATWESLMRTLDAGTMGADAGWAFRIVMLLVTVAGIFIVSSLIGVISAGVDNKIVELRKGRSRVLERDHTVILNWSPSIFDIIEQLAIANESRHRPRIVIMANKDKVEMEDEIAAKVSQTRNTRVICRSGDPTDLYDLAIVSLGAARSVIVLSPEGDDPDSAVIKTIMALVHDPRRRSERHRIAAEIREAKNAEVARVVGGREVQLVLGDDLISRIVVHSSRQWGLSAVYSELLDFDGCEIYTLPQPQLTGKTFAAAMMAYQTSTLIGLCDADGKIHLNPPLDMRFDEGSQAIVIAEDDATIALGRSDYTIDEAAIRTPQPVAKRPERTLLLGWNRRGPIIVYELSRYVAPGSTLTIVADSPDFEAAVAALRTANANLSIDHRIADTSRKTTLEELGIPGYDHVLVLGYSDSLPPQPADTRTLVTLLHIRTIAEAAGKHISVVSEMIDIRNRELAEVTRADDFVVSNKLVSLMLAQASENEYLSDIFDDLLDERSSEIYLRPASDYVALGTPVTFYTVTESARRRGELAIGWHRRRKGEMDARNMGGVLVNPDKAEAVTYEAGDRIIVLARD